MRCRIMPGSTITIRGAVPGWARGVRNLVLRLPLSMRTLSMVVLPLVCGLWWVLSVRLSASRMMMFLGVRWLLLGLDLGWSMPIVRRGIWQRRQPTL